MAYSGTYIYTYYFYLRTQYLHIHIDMYTLVTAYHTFLDLRVLLSSSSSVYFSVLKPHQSAYSIFESPSSEKSSLIYIFLCLNI